jgi:predicted nucleic acid-binding protein
MILVDTNIIIEVYKANNTIRNIIEDLGWLNIAVSDIVRAELFRGAKNKKELINIIEDIYELTTLPIEPQISEMAVEFIKKYCLSHNLEIPDALIAATAIYHNMELFTLNVKDFIFIPKIKLYNPLF